MPQPIDFSPGTKVRLRDLDAHDDGGIDKKRGEAETAENLASLDDYVYRLYAEDRRALLLVLQGTDTSGKDGVIRAVMSGISPQCCAVTSFKAPSAEELDHDFLWRIHRAIPPRGTVGIFNRSHYEDVLIVRVRQFASEAEWKSRYERINEFERLLVDGGVTIVKVCLHISRDEQRERLQARLNDPTKRWKFRLGDLDERKLWDDYQRAYDDALTRCNTEHAPWHVVPADRKWYRNLLVSRLLLSTLKKMNPQYPPSDPKLDGLIVE